MKCSTINKFKMPSKPWRGNVWLGCSPSSLILDAQIQLVDTKRQLETQVALHQKTKEMLNAAEFELRNLRMQQSGNESRHILSSPSATRVRGWHTLFHLPSHRSRTLTTRIKTFDEVHLLDHLSLLSAKVLQPFHYYCIPFEGKHRISDAHSLLSHLIC